MKLNWTIIAVTLVGSTFCVPTHAGDCPQGTHEVCPAYEKGEVGPCQCVANSSGGGHKARPMTIVNMTPTSPPPPLPPDLQKLLEGDASSRTQAQDNLKQMGLAATPHEPSKYQCRGSTCTCAGANDCVKMISADKKCKEGEAHPQCNTSGCTCDAK